jgi:hypothetical protein
LDSVEVVTDIAEVQVLNNRLFAPLWAKVGLISDFDTLAENEFPGFADE